MLTEKDLEGLSPAERNKLIDKEIEKRQRKILASLKREELYRNQNKIKFFKPHEKQQGIFNAATDLTKKTFIFQGGNRSGKTTWLITQLVSFLLGKELWSGRELRFKPPIRARLFGEDWTHHVGEVLIPKLKEWVPLSEVESTKKNNQGIDYHWVFKNGSILEIMTYEQATEITEGWSGHVAAADEPMPRDKYVATKRGLVDFDGVFLMSFTPLKEPWIFDELITNPDPAVYFENVDMRDNPHLGEDAIKEFEKSLTDDEKVARIKGGWLHLQGLVYKNFDKNVHVVKAFQVPYKWTVRVHIDTHPRTEQALVFLATDERDLWYVSKEIFKHGSPEDIVDWIIDYHIHTHRVHEVIIEPGSKGDANRGDTTFSIIQKGLAVKNIVLKEATKDLETGIKVVNDALKSRNGLPSLFIQDCCTRTIFEFTHYIWDDWRNKEGRTEKNKPKDKDDHMLEGIYRLLLLPPLFVDTTEQNRPLRMQDAGVA